MDRNVYLVIFADLFQTLVEILHILDKKGS